MSQMDLVSIIIPTYRRSSFIANSVFSCLNQTYRNIEVIIIDDNGANTDQQRRTQKVIENITLKDSRVAYYFYKSNMGANYARNYGVKQSSGELLAFLDDDDRWHQDKLVRQIELLKNNPKYCYAVCSYTKVLGKTRKKIPVGLPGTNQHFYLLDNLNRSFGLQLILLRKKDFYKAGMLDEDLVSAQDLEFIIRLTKFCSGIFDSESMVEIFVTHEDRISSNHDKKTLGYNQVLQKHVNNLPIKSKQFLHSRLLVLGIRNNDLRAIETSYFWLKKYYGVTLKQTVLRMIAQSKYGRGILNFYFKVKKV